MATINTLIEDQRKTAMDYRLADLTEQSLLRYMEQSDDDKSDDGLIQESHITSPHTTRILQKFDCRTISCNGDCGSQFAKLISNI